MIPNPYVLLGALVFWLASIVGAFAYGHHIDSLACKASQVEAEHAAQQQKDAEAKQAAQASTNLEAGNAQAEIVYRTITRTVDRVVDRPVYHNVCLDADGLRLANDALAGSSPTTSKPDATMPGAGPAQ